MTSATVTPTRETIGRRIRLAREHAQVTQEELATQLRIPRPSVSELEAGRRDLSSLELAALASFLRKPLAWFLASDEGFEPGAWNPERFRLRGGQLTAADRLRLLDFASRSLEYAELEELVGVRASGAQIPPPRYRDLSGRHIDQGRAIAELERSRLHLGSQPVGDAVSLLEQQGVKVLDWEMPAGSAIDGALFVSAETGPCILLNRQGAPARRQFTAAHEYAHLLLDVDDDQAEVCFRDGTTLAEKRANAFAAEFLSPTSGVIEFLESRGVPRRRPVGIRDVLELQRYFNVSYEAALWRLLNLGMIDATSRGALAQFRPSQLMRQLGMEAPEANTEALSSSRFANLAFRAWELRKITRGKLAELLGIDKSDIDELVRSVATPRTA